MADLNNTFKKSAINHKSILFGATFSESLLSVRMDSGTTNFFFFFFLNICLCSNSLQEDFNYEQCFKVIIVTKPFVPVAMGHLL